MAFIIEKTSVDARAMEGASDGSHTQVLIVVHGQVDDDAICQPCRK